MTKRNTAKDFFVECNWSAINNNITPLAEDEHNDDEHLDNDDDYDTSLHKYLENSIQQQMSNDRFPDNNSTRSCPTLSDHTNNSHSEDYSKSDDDASIESIQEDTDCNGEDNATIFSLFSSATGKNDDSDATITLGDELPKSFLQLTGIAIANFNTSCNFRVEKAIGIMIQYELTILAIQEHTPWNRKLSDAEITSIERHCDHWGFFVKISELQIVIFDKQILACHRDTTVYEDGRVIKCRFEISKDTYVTFVPVYGVAHFSGDQKKANITSTEENTKLEKMTAVKTIVEKIIDTASANADLVYVFGDLQDTPDQSKTFHRGSCCIPKHPLGIVKACESKGLVCTIYQHLHTFDKPVISCHGSKGGRFIDSVFASPQGTSNVLGIHFINDAGVHSDHDLVISKIDFGIEKFEVKKEKEERFNFQKIMNIPVHTKSGENHPSLNNTVFKGADFRVQEQLYNELQSVATDPECQFMPRLEELRLKLVSYEKVIIDRTKSLITSEDQANGKLIPRTPEDAAFINDTSSCFLTLINDVCREANLANNVPVLKPPLKISKKRDVASEKKKCLESALLQSQNKLMTL